MGVTEESTASPQFVAFPPGKATGLTMRRIYKAQFVFLAGGATALVALLLCIKMSEWFHWDLPPALMAGLGPGIVGAFVLGYVVFGLRRRRDIIIRVASDGLTVNMRPGDVFSIADAKLGVWGPGKLTVGTALHLQCGPHSFVVGGRDHRLATEVPLGASPVDCPDAWMSASSFDELLTVVSARGRLDVRGPAPGEPIRCLLFPNETMQAVVSWAFGEKLPFSSPPQPRLAIDVDDDEMRVIDLKTNALKASAPPTQVTAEPKTYTKQMPRATWTSPVLVLAVPGLQPLTIGCHEGNVGMFGLRPRLPWNTASSHRANEPAAYMVTSRDWLTLVEMCGLTGHLDRDETQG